MPNWCSGNIRFRGKYDDIVRMLKNELKYCYYGNDRKIHENNCELDIHEKYREYIEIEPPKIPKLDSDRSGWWYWNETQRAFPGDGGNIEVKLWQTNEGGDIYIAYMDDFRQAWGICPDDWVRYSTEYNLDVKIFGWECGMQFSQEVEIIDGEIIENNTIPYDNWDWYSPLPTWGG